MSSSFQFEGLDLTEPSVRLLDVLPAEEGHPIRCQLHTWLLDLDGGLPDYKAVSYEWGTLDQGQGTVEINGKAFEIRQNLHDFLTALTVLYPNGIQNLWIDAICIDQGNLREKSHQVQQMATIYSRASMVLVWLGLATGSSDLVFDVLNTCPAQHLVTGEEVGDKTGPEVQRWENNLIFQEINICPAIIELYHRRYWSRTWIVQEILRARRIELICGFKTVTWAAWTYLTSFLTDNAVTSRYMNGIHTKNKRHAVKLLKARSRFMSEVKPENIISIINNFGEFDCENPRDKVYAMLGLCNDVQLEVDYTLSTLALFFNTIEASLNSDNMPIEEIYEFCTLLRLRPRDLVAELYPSGQVLAKEAEWLPQVQISDPEQRFGLLERALRQWLCEVDDVLTGNRVNGSSLTENPVNFTALDRESLLIAWPTSGPWQAREDVMAASGARGLRLGEPYCILSCRCKLCRLGRATDQLRLSVTVSYLSKLSLQYYRFTTSPYPCLFYGQAGNGPWKYLATGVYPYNDQPNDWGLFDGYVLFYEPWLAGTSGPSDGEQGVNLPTSVLFNIMMHYYESRVISVSHS